MKYFKTNEQLSYILDEYGTGIQWPAFGFSVKEISKAIANGFQQNDHGEIVSILPISDEKQFRASLGSLLNSPKDNPYFLVLSEAEALAERDRLKAENAAAAQSEPVTEELSLSQKLDMLIEVQADMIGGAV